MMMMLLKTNHDDEMMTIPSEYNNDIFRMRGYFLDPLFLAVCRAIILVWNISPDKMQRA